MVMYPVAYPAVYLPKKEESTMQRNKIFSILLTVMMIFLAVGCSNSKSNNPEVTESPAPAATTEPTSAAEPSPDAAALKAKSSSGPCGATPNRKQK